MNQRNQTNDIFDTASVRDDGEHWDAMALRVVQKATSRARPARGFAGFVASSRAWVASGVLVGAAAGLAIVARAGLRGEAGAEVASAVQPADFLGRSLSGGASPPSVGALLLSVGRPGETR